MPGLFSRRTTPEIPEGYQLVPIPQEEIDPYTVPADISVGTLSALEGRMQELIAKVESLSGEMQHMVVNRDFNLRLSEYLIPELETLIGSTVVRSSIVDSTKVVTFNDVRVVIDPFNGRLEFYGVEQQVESLTVHFGADQRLSTASRRQILGFMSEVRFNVIGSDFWRGTTDSAGIRASDALSVSQASDRDFNVHVSDGPDGTAAYHDKHDREA